MREIRIHGRGGQGVVTAAELIAQAAFQDGKIVQAFPSFGSERMGSPVQSFVRISDQKIRSRNQILNPDYVIVQDPTLLSVIDVLAGIKSGGIIIINTEKTTAELNLKTDALVYPVPASKLALETIGRPIPNTVLLGAFAAATGEISLEGIKKSIQIRFPGEAGEKNIQAAEKAYHLVKEKK